MKFNFVLFMSSLLVSDNIINGFPLVEIKDYPFAVSVVLLPKPMHGKENPAGIKKCGGVIIGKIWAISTASCFIYIDVNLIRNGYLVVRGNTSQWDNQTLWSSDHTVITYTSHEYYYYYNGSPAKDYNIALIKVSLPFHAKYENPAIIASKNFQYTPGLQLSVLGWESQYYLGPLFNYLQITYARITNSSNCHLSEKFTERQLCTSGGGIGIPCYLDEGGGLVLGNKVVAISTGIDGTGCRTALSIKLSYLRDWFTENIAAMKNIKSIPIIQRKQKTTL